LTKKKVREKIPNIYESAQLSMLIPNMQKNQCISMAVFRNPAWFSKDPIENRSSDFFLRKDFAYENMLLGLGYLMLKTAGL
jgi:hypothetical protein